MGQTNDSHTTETQNPQTRAEAPSTEALARAEAAAAAIPDTELIAIRVDVTSAAGGAIGQMEAIEAQRAEVVQSFGEEAARVFDDVVPAAHHLIVANGRFNASGDRDLEPAAASLREKRTRLFLVASALEKRGLTVEVLGKLEGGQSYTALANDTQALYHWLSAHLVEVAPHCKLTAGELDAVQAEVLAFVGSVGKKARAGSGRAAVERARAFTHFARTYDQVRKYVTYVRWHHGDYDEIAPSIYAGRSRKDTPPLAPVAPNNIAPGLPGASPFAPNT